MKSGIVRATILGFLAVFVGVGSARGATIALADVSYDPADIYMVGSSSAVNCPNDPTGCNTLSWTFVLADWLAGDVVTAASFTVYAYDDNVADTPPPGGHAETFNISLDGTASAGNFYTVSNFSTTGQPISISFQLSTLSDGQVQAILTLNNSSANNDFYFARATLTGITATRDLTSSAVPEPASMFLLGTGLVGVGAAVRKRRRAEKNA